MTKDRFMMGSYLNSELQFFDSNYIQMIEPKASAVRLTSEGHELDYPAKEMKENTDLIRDNTISRGETNRAASTSRYEAQKRRDWNTFGQFLRNHRPPLAFGRCNGTHVLDFLRYLDQFGKTKVHTPGCALFGVAMNPPQLAQCACPLRQAWGSLDALVGRLRAAFEEHCRVAPEANPFAARSVRLHLREVREQQAKARGIAYHKKKRKRPSLAAIAKTPSLAPTTSDAAIP